MAVDKRNFIIFDLETSGIDPEGGAEIVEIAATSLRWQDYAFHENGDFHLILKPKTPEKASPEAIKVIGENLWNKALNEGIDQKVGLKKFIEYIHSFNYMKAVYTLPTMVGYNIIGFDMPFITYYLKQYKLIKTRDDCPWSIFSKDVLHQMTDLFAKDNLTNRKLDTFCNIMGMSRKQETHSALEDVKLTAQLFVRYMKMMEVVRSKLKINNEPILTIG